MRALVLCAVLAFSSICDATESPLYGTFSVQKGAEIHVWVRVSGDDNCRVDSAALTVAVQKALLESGFGVLEKRIFKSGRYFIAMDVVTLEAAAKVCAGYVGTSLRMLGPKHTSPYAVLKEEGGLFTGPADRFREQANQVVRNHSDAIIVELLKARMSWQKKVDKLNELRKRAAERKKRGAVTEEEKLAEFCAEIPQSALCKPLTSEK